MSIAENILNATAKSSDISPKKELDEYFSSAVFDDKLWPFDFKKEDVKTEYLCAHIMPDKFGFSEELHLDTKFSFDNYTYTLSEKISAEDGLEIELISLIRQGHPKANDQFIYKLLNKHYDFIKEFALKNHIDPNEAKIKIHAHSGNVDGIQTIGGYVWASYGFEFGSEKELNQARQAFQRFAKEHNVLIEDKDLKYFKYPCHFAAFDNGDKIDGNPLGKAFLLNYEWFGVRNADTPQNAETLRYQKAYHEKSKEAAQAELSKSFLAVMNKYKHKNAQKENTFDRLSIIKEKLLEKIFQKA